MERNCAEPKAASAAHKNKSKVVGMDTRYYTSNSNNKNLINGTNQMKPCDTCEEYMEESAYKRKDDTLESLAHELIREYDLECAWFNDQYFLYAHNKEISIIFCKGLAIYGVCYGK